MSRAIGLKKKKEKKKLSLCLLGVFFGHYIFFYGYHKNKNNQFHIKTNKATLSPEFFSKKECTQRPQAHRQAVTELYELLKEHRIVLGKKFKSEEKALFFLPKQTK